MRGRLSIAIVLVLMLVAAVPLLRTIVAPESDREELRGAENSGNVKWTDAKFTSFECSEETICEATVKLKYNYTFTKRSLGGMEVETDVLENWIKLEDKWYYVPKNN